MGIIFAGVVFATMLMMIGAIYAGGGTEALRRQAPILGLMAAALVAIALLILLLSNEPTNLRVIGIAAAAAAAIAAAMQGANLARNRTGPSLPVSAISFWAVAIFLFAVAFYGLVFVN